MVALTQKLVQGLVLSLSLSSSLFLTSNAQAPSASQPPAPQPTAPQPPTGPAPNAFIGVASASNKNFIFYHGGQLNTAPVKYTNELYSIDLTKSWPISAPAWTNLTSSNGPSTARHAATMSADGNTLLVTAPNTNGGPYLYQYNIASGSWSGVNTPKAQVSAWTTRVDASFVTDPSTGASYLLGGAFADGTSTNAVDKFQNGVWAPALSLSSTAGAPSSSVLSNFNSGTAHLHNNRIYIFGGFGSTSGQRGYQSFQNLPYIDISTSTFGSQLTAGPIPPPRQDHCSVVTASKKVIVFGGYDGNAKLSLKDIWSLDLITLTWSQIIPTNENVGRPRHGHSCDIAGANMIVFGGVANIAGQTGLTGYAKDTQVYDVMLTAWMTSYAPKQDTTPITSTNGNSAPGSGGLGIGAIIGIVIGVFVIIVAGLALFIYKRRQKQIEIREAELEKEAYLASLRPEGGDQANKSSHSPASARFGGASIISTPGMAHSGVYNGMDELLMNNSSASPALGGHGQGNVQYLMQHLPDGTIAVQPVYLDHHTVQSSPNMGTSDNQGYISPMMSATNGGYYAPPAQTPQVTYPQPSHDPFASPVVPNVPLPPGYHSSSSGLGSPQQMPGQLR
ncbi:hypothetical protein BGX27_010436 [Mortierella sp. AM989]|nr:hypothetical protein BGX27_010436 [Mortierella sp. AM989]